MKPDSQCSRLLAVLADGRWHTSRELHERCGYMRTNSRIAELRSYGYEIPGESVPGKTGTDGYRYRLTASLLGRPAEDATTALVQVLGGPLEHDGQLTLLDAA